MGFGVQGLGFRVHGLGFRVRGPRSVSPSPHVGRAGGFLVMGLYAGCCATMCYHAYISFALPLSTCQTGRTH